jgi:AcrR family transcriptional regulator
MTYTLRERRKLMLEEEILEAAQALLTEKGYAAMSMDELAARVGISKPTLYSYFTNKDTLVLEALLRGIERVLEALHAAPAEMSPLDRLALFLRTAAQRQVERGHSEARAWSPEVAHLLHASERGCALFQRIDQAIVSLVQQAFDQGQINPLFDLPTVVRVVYALVAAPKFPFVSQSGDCNPATLPDMLAAIFRRGVRAEGGEW